jgi:hypothetical protein
MRDKTKKIILAIMLCTTNSSNADLLSSTPTSLDFSAQAALSAQSLTGAFSIPGFSNITLSCTKSFSPNIKDTLGEIPDFCSAINKIKNSITFGIGPCSITGTIGDCAKRRAQNLCTNIRSEAIVASGLGPKILLSPLTLSLVSIKGTMVSGGDIVMAASKESCNSKIDKAYDGIRYGKTTENDIAKATTMSKMRNSSAFGRDVDMARDCIRVGTLAGIPIASLTKKCSTGENVALPANKSSADQAVADTATKLMLPPDSKLSSSMMATEAAVSKKLINCSNSDDYEVCKNIQLSSSPDTDMAKMKDSLVTNTELIEGKKLKLFEDAAKGKRLIVHFDDESISNLPIQSKSIYASAMKRQLDFMTSYRYLFSENTSLTKEVEQISTTKITESARPFFESKALQSIKDVISQ